MAEHEPLSFDVETDEFSDLVVVLHEEDRALFHVSPLLLACGA